VRVLSQVVHRALDQLAQKAEVDVCERAQVAAELCVLVPDEPREQ
jgi:hypothetical protein